MKSQRHPPGIEGEVMMRSSVRLGIADRHRFMEDRRVWDAATAKHRTIPQEGGGGARIQPDGIAYRLLIDEKSARGWMRPPQRHRHSLRA